MTATINEHGVLEVKAETALESYALDQWTKENFSKPSESAIDTKNICINVGFDN